MRHTPLATVIVPALVAVWLQATPLAAAGPDFNRDVRPILSNRCFKCHGPDEEHQEAGLRLDVREAAIAELDSGERAIVPGHADSSELVARIVSDDPDLVMPPPATKVALTADEKRILTDWVKSGAEYAPHWAFVKPTMPELPSVADEAWIKNPIDRFVLAKLEKEKLEPSAQADKATLCRRVHLDLVGLPPSPDELKAFLADTSPEAYENLVDRLLASPRYGERWARRWLDLARYADTNGYEKDRPRPIWPWRDWVIRALNEDMPFDQFTIRQIAGDMLPDATATDIIATGFHRNTMHNEEGGIDPLEYRYLAVVDRVGTTGATWLGLTTACAQCHTHKYDPITHQDYFSLFALLNNADEPEWIMPTGDRVKRLAEVRTKLEALWEDLPRHWPAPATTSDESAGSTAPGHAVTGMQSSRDALDAQFATWSREESSKAVDWKVVRPEALESTMPHLVIQDDASVLASGDQTKSDAYSVTLARVDIPVRSIRLEVLPHESLPAWGPGMCFSEGEPGEFFLSEFEVRGTSAGERIEVVRATESFGGKAAHSNSVSRAADAIDGVMSTGWGTNGHQGRAEAAVFELARPVPAGEPIVVTMRFERHFACPLGRFRISVSETAAESRGHTADVEAALVKAPEGRTDAERKAVFRRFLAAASELSEQAKEIDRLEASLREGLSTLVMRERPADNPRKTHRHHRGEFTQPEEEVSPAVPAFLPQLPKNVPADRLALAKWLVSADNPLTARVTVNRQWEAFFGRGIVTTVADFGYQGATPSHPELLDWLAVSFMEPKASGGLGWSLKSLHRLIVTSATYRQDSRLSPGLAERDPTNALLARGPRVRLDAEVIRDSLLAASGLLSDKMYGPGVRPPQPEGVTEVAWGAPKWIASTGEDRYRRSIYTFQKRTAPFAFTTTFDGPTGDACIPRRDISNSPLQALTLLNDPMFLEIARALGKIEAATESDDAARLDALAVRLYARPLDADEHELLRGYLETQRKRLAAGELDANELAGCDSNEHPMEQAAWILVARAMMNLDEAIVKR